MRHRSSTRHFNRDSKAREALIVSLVSNVALTGAIVTTKPMAKEAARHLDKLIVRAKKGDVASARVLHRFFGKRQLVNKFINEIAPAFADRASGFTSITYFGQRRGDNAELFTLKFVSDIPVRAEKKDSKFKTEEKKKTAPAAKVEKKASVKPKKETKKTK